MFREDPCLNKRSLWSRRLMFNEIRSRLVVPPRQIHPTQLTDINTLCYLNNTLYVNYWNDLSERIWRVEMELRVILTTEKISVNVSEVCPFGISLILVWYSSCLADKPGNFYQLLLPVTSVVHDRISRMWAGHRTAVETAGGREMMTGSGRRTNRRAGQLELSLSEQFEWRGRWGVTG